jgi:hypothetical protein
MAVAAHRSIATADQCYRPLAVTNSIRPHELGRDCCSLAVDVDD